MIQKSRLVALTQRLLQINSENPPGKEEKIAQFVIHHLRSLGLEIKTVSYVKGRPNVIATLKGAGPRARACREAVLLTPHVDTVPAGKGWRYDPFGGKIVAGKIYGRGASDDKGNLACAMEVMRSLVEDGLRFKRDVVLAATVDEETGSKAGVVPLLLKRVLRPGIAVVLDSDEFNVIVAQKGLIHCRVQIFGKKAHGAYNWRGVNAIEQAAEIIQKVKVHKFRYTKHRLLRPPTLNVGVIRGGDKVNMVADFCEFALDIRYLPGMDPKKILTELRQIIVGVAKRYKIMVDDLQFPYEISPRHPAVQSYVTANHRCKIKAELKGSEGATVITFFKKMGIPAFATGYGKQGTAHTTDEYAEIETLYRGAQVLEQFLKDYDEHDETFRSSRTA